MSRREVTFNCPRCSNHQIEEVLTDVVVASKVTTLEIEDGAAFLVYGKQTNEGGHVDRYQCGECGYTIISDACEYDELTVDGLGEEALVKAIDILNKAEIVTKVRTIEMSRMRDDGTWDTVMVDIPADTHRLYVEESGRAAAEEQYGDQSSYSLYNSMDDDCPDP